MIKTAGGHRLLAAFILLFASNVMSREVSFDYVQISYISDTIDPGSSIDEVEGNGIGLELSLGFSPAFALSLAVASTTFDVFQGVVVGTAKTSSLGVTAHTSIASGTDIFANVSVLKAEITATDGVDSASDSDIGANAEIGLRYLVTDIFEVEVAASRSYLFGYELDAYAIDSRLYVWKGLSVGLGYVGNSEVESLWLNARMDI